MGIQNLNKLIKEHAPGAITVIKDAGELDLWRIGVDASMSIYQWCAAGKHRNIVNREGKFINHIQGAFFRTLSMILAGAHPSYVFDGKPPDLKGRVIAERKALRDAGDAVRVPREVFAEVVKLLDLMGVTHVQAPSEAEAQIAVFTQTDVLDAAATEDTDALAFGAKYMIQGLDTAARSVTVIEHDKVLKGLGLARDQFVDLCILLGCDYTGTLPKVGYKRAYAYIKKWGSIEAILREEKITPPEDFDYAGAREIFMKPEAHRTRYDPEVRRLGPDDIERLRDFLVNTHGLEPSRVNRSLARLERFHAGSGGKK